jgi:hypothetical protein
MSSSLFDSTSQDPGDHGVAGGYPRISLGNDDYDKKYRGERRWLAVNLHKATPLFRVCGCDDCIEAKSRYTISVKYPAALDTIERVTSLKKKVDDELGWEDIRCEQDEEKKLVDMVEEWTLVD